MGDSLEKLRISTGKSDDECSLVSIIEYHLGLLEGLLITKNLSTNKIKKAITFTKKVNTICDKCLCLVTDDSERHTHYLDIRRCCGQLLSQLKQKNEDQLSIGQRAEYSYRDVTKWIIRFIVIPLLSHILSLCLSVPLAI
jgi:hypothetical protein